MAERGEVRAVQWVQQGSDLNGNVAVGSLTLTVDNPVDFDEDGGTLQLNGLTYEYGTVDLDSGIITLDAPLTVAASDNDRVLIVSGGAVAIDYVAFVSLGDGDEVEVQIKYGDRDLWPEGEYDDPIVVDLSNDLEEILTVPGRTPIRDGTNIIPGTLPIFGYQDSLTCIGPGDVMIPLTYQPLGVTTVHVYWNGLQVPTSDFTVSGWTVNVVDAGGKLRAGDVLEAQYLWSDPTQHVASLSYLGVSEIPHGASVATSSVTAPIPVGVAAGDYFVFSLAAGASFGDHSADCGDSRAVFVDKLDMSFGGSWPERYCVGWGRLSSIALPISFTSHAVDGTAEGIVSFYRIDGALTQTLSSGDPTNVTAIPCFPTIELTDVGILAVSGLNATKIQPSESLSWTARDPTGTHNRAHLWDSQNPDTASLVHITDPSNNPVSMWLAMSIGVS